MEYRFASITQACPFSSETPHGYKRVMIHPGLNLCEVGLNCHPQCPYSFKAQNVEPCPTCGGNPNVDQPPYTCATCDVFGIVRTTPATL